MENIFLEGLFLQASLIFALGAQNIFVLESGLRKNHPLTVSIVCFLCDLFLILLGVAGAATLLHKLPQLKVLVGLMGVIFLFYLGMQKCFQDYKELQNDIDGGKILGLRKTILLSITFSILNPHAYLDAFILIGGYSMKYEMLNSRLALGLGAASFSLIWFLLLTNASFLVKPYLNNPVFMRRILSTMGLILIFLSGKLGLDVLGWIGEDLGIKLNMIPYPIVGQYFSSILY